MTAALLGTVFMASLAGSLHCAGMCGGFVAFYSGNDPGKRGRELEAQPELAPALVLERVNLLFHVFAGLRGKHLEPLERGRVELAVSE